LKVLGQPPVVQSPLDGRLKPVFNFAVADNNVLLVDIDG
jgi:hypothetical protein